MLEKKKDFTGIMDCSDRDELFSETLQATWRINLSTGQAWYSREWVDILLLDENVARTGDTDWWKRHIHAEDKAVFQNAYDAVCNGGSFFEVTIRLQRTDTSWVWVMARGKVRSYAGQSDLFLSGIVIDVSMLRVSNRFVPCSVQEANYRAILDRSPEMIIRFDRELFPLYVNAAIRKYLPLEASALGNRTIEEVKVSAANIDFFRENTHEVFETGVIIKKVAEFPSSVSGDTTGEYSFWPEFDEAGHVQAVICQVRDITSQQIMEREERATREHFARLYQLTQLTDSSLKEVGDFVVDSLVKITSSTHGFLYLLPNPSSGEVGRYYWSRSRSDETDDYQYDKDADAFGLYLDRLIRMASDINKPLFTNGNGVTPLFSFSKGHFLVMRYMRSVVQEDGEAVCLAWVCNKSADYAESELYRANLFLNGAWLAMRRHSYVHTLKEAKEAAEVANKVKDQFVANISHELRTPLNGILSMLQLLESSGLNDEQHNYAAMASTSGQALLRIISDILDFSRMASGRMHLHVQTFDLNGLLHTAISLFKNEFEKKNLELTLHIADAVPDALIGDDARVRQIIFNLLGNALKFTDHGGVVVECSVLPYKKAGRICIYITVADTGIGIVDEQHDRIFEVFTQIEHDVRRPVAGTGLGLGIVKSLVKLMDGSLTVESTLNVGTVMHCSLPFAAGVFVAHSENVLTPVSASKFKLSILVAEDDAVSRFAMQNFLERKGHKVHCVENGKEALQALCDEYYDCLVTDIQMPVMGGIELVRRVRSGELPVETTEAFSKKLVLPDGQQLKIQAWEESIQHIPIVALTAHAMTGDKERFMEQGMDLYISKPIINAELDAVLHQVNVLKLERAGYINGAAKPL